MSKQLQNFHAEVLKSEVEDLTRKLLDEKERTKRNWTIHCQRLADQEARFTAKEDEVAALKHQLA